MLNCYKLKSLSLLLAASVSFPIYAALPESQVETLDMLKTQALNDDTAYQIIESLTTEVGARMVGTEGEARSVEWAMQKMKSLGFDKVWKEESEVTLWSRGSLKLEIAAPFPHPVVGLTLGGSVGTNGETLTAEVVEFNTLEALKAAKKGSLEGKIAFVSYRMERHEDGHGYGEAVGARVAGASIAADKGAVAFLLRSVGTDTNRFAHTGVMHYEENVKKIPAIALSNPDADLLVNSLQRGKPVTFSINSTASGPTNETVTIANVIGEVTGSEQPQEVVTLGAHLDSWDVGTGAIDDGIGIGITLAAGHYIAQLPQAPKRSVRVILFAAEEIGLAGAKDYVVKHKEEMDQHVMGAEWDFGNGNIYSMEPGVGPEALASIRDFADYLAPMGIAYSSKNSAKGQSDMSALGNEGQPAVNFDPDGSDYFDYHHTKNDTLDKVNQAALKNNTAVYTAFAYYAADSNVNFRK
ncbi:M28 family peptidase [Alteromonas pelagimontana]|uniref:Carboxypeptidase Q n=1 Tax=Alteromonas pelagimontana TaxID=1858656 RepID=A0A6M4MDJ8_9ALTE|nr:M28 family peptidase [Alteromonas pelagimontana]QJR81264.1 M28 family peptidase [Alteromonas pelagimontana]